MVKPYYSEKIREYSKDLKEFQFTVKDIEKTIEFIEKMLQAPNDGKEQYQVFTRIELMEKLKESIEFIKERL